VTKIVLALHGTGRADRLLGAGLREQLSRGGATRVQVNLDDEPVAGALRFGPGRPVTALVSVWTSGAAAAAVEAVVAAAGDPEVHAYRVTEKVRLDPLPTPDGVRADVFAQVALLRRPGSMPRKEWWEYWQVHHTPIAIRTQNTSGYVQNLVEEALTPGSPEIAAVVEEDFPMAALTDPHEFYGSRGDDAELHRRMSELRASVARFGADRDLDLVPSSRYAWVL
jgi:hypothetical protein